MRTHHLLQTSRKNKIKPHTPPHGIQRLLKELGVHVVFPFENGALLQCD